MRWRPRNNVRTKARIARGWYVCAGYECEPHNVTTSLHGAKNTFVDHIHPVVDVEEGFIDWNKFIEGLFCEEDNLQLLCKACHDRKTADEREARKKK